MGAGVRLTGGVIFNAILVVVVFFFILLLLHQTFFPVLAFLY